MKIRDKYKALQNAKSVKAKIVSSVYSTMMLEDQGVSIKKLQKLYDEVNASTAKAGAAV